MCVLKITSSDYARDALKIKDVENLSHEWTKEIISSTDLWRTSEHLKSINNVQFE